MSRYGVLLFSIFALCFSNIVQGQTLDQSQTAFDYAFWFESSVERWQEFKPSVANLSRVEVLLNRAGSPGNVIVKIASSTGQVLQSQTIPQASVPTNGNWVGVDLSPALTLTPGTTYRLVVSADASSPDPSNRFFWAGKTSSSYTRGVSSVESGWPGFDFGFKTYSGTVSQMVQVISPNGGENWVVGSVRTVSWTKTSGVETSLLYYSINGGSYNFIKGVSGTSYDWTIPNTPSTQVRFEVIGTDAATTFSVYDLSDGLFTISFGPQPETVQLGSPNGGENWAVPSSHNITWTYNGISNVKLEYSTNNGSIWSTIVSSTAASSGSYPWTVPNTPSAQCLVRASDAADGTPSDQSNANFTISSGPGASIKPITALATYPSGSEFVVQVKVGDPNVVANLYGVSFKLRSGNGSCSYVDGSATAGDFLGTSPLTFFQKVDNQTVDMAISKTSGSGNSGTGVVASAKFVTPSSLPSGIAVNFTIENTSANDPSGGSVSLSALSLTVQIATGIAVWPGDCDNNGTVTGADVLKIGLYYGQTRSGSNNPGTAWQAYSRAAWPGDTPAQRVYADANGDGTVTGADVLAVGLNYGKTHSLNKTSTVMTADPHIPSSAGSLQLLTGATTLLAEEVPVDIRLNSCVPVFGIAFRLAYRTSSKAVEMQLSSEKGVLGDALQFCRVVESGRFVDIALTKTEGVGFSGEGVLAKVLVHAAVAESPVELEIIDITANDENGNPVILGGSSLSISREMNEGQHLPNTFVLSANYPNPFNPSTTISYGLPTDVDVTLTVFDVLGRPVKNLVRGHQTAGLYKVTWEGREEGGSPVGSGMYVYMLTARDGQNSSLYTESRRMLYIK